MSILFDIIRKKLMVRRVLIIGAHTALYALAFFGAFLLRFDFTIPEDQRQNFWLGLGLIVVLRLIAGFVFRIYRGVLRYAGISDLMDILKSMSLATAALVVALVLLGFRGFPRSVIAIDWVASIMLVGGLRFALRVVREALTAEPEELAERRRRVLILGAGDAGEALVRDLLRTYRDRYEVVGFLDDNKSKMGLRIHDVPVLGPILYLGDFVPRYRVDEVIVAIPSASGAQMRQIVDITKIAGVRIKTIPSIDQLIDGSVTVNQIRDVAIEDLLGRDPVELEEGLLRKFLFGKVVMVTGAGGSIGAEMCRQICRYRPRKLLLVEQNEPSLFFIHRELLDGHPDVPVVPIIADVTDVRRLERVFEDYGPEIIFHAAAHKHVPMMEWNPGEAVKNNVFGTRVVADMANVFGAQAFVMISTDKAVNPTSVMGATKRVAEMYVQALSAGSRTKYTAVRFGNVLGSTGSVVPIFKEQIAAGGPVTVTDPEMRRYFMTIPESCQLVMQSAAMGAGGEIFVLDMGEPVKILDLARDLITLSGFAPEADIPIVFTGLRPGEKLFEEIGFDEEKMDKTRHPKIYTGKLVPHPLDEMQALLRRLVSVVDETDEAVVKGALRAIVPEFETEVGAYLPSTEGAVRPVAKPGPRPAKTSSPPAPAAPAEPEAEDESTSTPAARPRVAMEDTPEGLNPLFEASWQQFVDLCRSGDFLSAGWHSMGVKPPDRREWSSDEGHDLPEAQRGLMRRSVPITSLAFIELWFVYEGPSGRRTPEAVRRAVRDISQKMTRQLVDISRQVASDQA